MTDIELHAKTDRELLILVATKLNGVCVVAEDLKNDINGHDNSWGIKTQVRILWGLAVGVWSVVLIVIGVVVKAAI